MAKKRLFLQCSKIITF